MIEFAKSMAGHDRNHIYLVTGKDERFVYLADGNAACGTEEKEQKTYSDYSQITGGGAGMSGAGNYRSYGKEGNQSVCAYLERACRIIILGGFIYVKGRCD